MSFLKRMFGGASAEDERAEGDRLFDKQDYFGARQAYQRALSLKAIDGDLKAHCQRRMDECLDALAEARLSDAEEMRKHGDIDLARAEITNAIELARSKAVRDRAQRQMERLERADALASATEVTELSDDERWSIIAGSWQEDQIEEHDRYGEPLRAALLELHEGNVKEARPALEQLAEAHPDDAVYLWLEVGRARLIDGDEQGAGNALRKFLKRLDDDDRSDARINAHLALSSIAEKAGDEEKAISWLQKAVDAMPDDPRPYYQLGVYLRQKGYAEEAVEVLETAIGLLDERPHWQVQQELALAKRDAGREDEALELLERVIRFFVQRSQTDYPASTAVPLAQLYERSGQLERAADLYRTLADGSDRANHLTYHREAARVLIEMGLLAEARRMLTRAAALAETQPEVLAEIEAKIAELDEEL